MPSISKRQHKFFSAVANNPAFAEKVGVDRKVGEDFEKADRKQQRFWKGGTKAKVNKPNTAHGKVDMPYTSLREYAGKKEGGLMKSKSEIGKQQKEMGDTATYAKGGGIESRGKTKGTIVKMARGGGIESRGKTKGKII